MSDGRYELREVEGGWALVSLWPAVPPDTPPPADMPPLEVVVLDALTDGDETIHTMRDCGVMPPSGPALVGEDHLLATLRALIEQGRVAVVGEIRATPDCDLAEEPVDEPQHDDASLRRYWFSLTEAGEAAWNDAAEQLDAYYGREDAGSSNEGGP